MIIDCHMYCFAPIDSPTGYATVEEKMRTVQSELGGHSQPVWSIRDRAPADNSTLVDPATGRLREVTWTRHNGNLAWICEGETYTKQHTPPMLHNLESTPELMVAEMDYAGVDMGVMHTYASLGTDRFTNEYLREAVGRFPDRLMRLVRVTEAAVPTDPEAAAQKVRNEVALGERIGLQFVPGFYSNPTGGSLEGHEEPWDDGALRPFWQAVAAMNIPVFFTLIGGRGAKLYDGGWAEAYIEEQRTLLRWMERYPEVTTVITHGIPWRAFMQDGRVRLPDAVWEVFEAPQCHLQLLIPIQMGAMWEYPWKEAEPIVRECVERVGADRLMWGTDMPMVARFCTYRQAKDQFGVHCEFLTDGQRQDILGGTIARVMGIEAPTGVEGGSARAAKRS